MSTVGVYVMFSSFDFGAIVYHFMCERCRLPTFVSFPLALVPTAILWMIGYASPLVITNPARIVDPSWRAPDDDLDELTLINVKIGILTALCCGAALATWYSS